MAAIQCTLDIPKVSGLEDGQLTVGREFYLICKGEWPKNLKQENLQFAGDKNTQYQLKLLSFEFRSPEEADIKVTSYLAARHQFPQLQLTDGEQVLDLGPLQFDVQSVLPQQNPVPNPAGEMREGATGEPKPEPYGPMGPATIGIPVLYWVILLSSLFLVALFTGLRIWRYYQRREMLLRLKEHDAALSPLVEFHQSMRRLQRSNPVFFGKEATEQELREGLAELSRMFKIYLTRRLRVPAFEWSGRLIARDIRKYHAHVYEAHSRRIRDLFSEFKKAEMEGSKLQAKDLSQLAESLRKTLEGIENVLSQEGHRRKGKP